MSYNHRQESCIYTAYLIVGSICTLGLIVGYSIAIALQEWQLMGSFAGLVWGATLLCQAGIYKFLQIGDYQNDKLRINWNSNPERYGIDLEYTNIKSFTKTRGTL